MTGWIICGYESEGTPTNEVTAIWNGAKLIKTSDINKARFLPQDSTTLNQLRKTKAGVQGSYTDYDIRAVKVSRALTMI
ncbi:MAG: hypothetical protein AAGF93_05440 [Cyanobacteria bacterium P01_H01_bin.105]